MMIRVANVFMLILHVDWYHFSSYIVFICLITLILTLSYSLSSHFHVQQRRCCFQESSGDEEVEVNDILEGDYVNETEIVKKYENETKIVLTGYEHPRIDVV